MWVIEEIKRGEVEILFKHYHSDPRPVYALYTEKDKNATESSGLH